jgi:hypothetical protein
MGEIQLPTNIFKARPISDAPNIKKRIMAGIKTIKPVNIIGDLKDCSIGYKLDSNWFCFFIG